jgi:hypothetical protein
MPRGGFWSIRRPSGTNTWTSGSDAFRNLNLYTPGLYPALVKLGASVRAPVVEPAAPGKPNGAAVAVLSVSEGAQRSGTTRNSRNELAAVGQAEFIGKIRLFGVKLSTSILASAAFLKI